MEIFRDIQPDISVNEVCRLLGRGKGAAASPRTVKTIKRLIKETTPLLSPQVVTTERNIHESNEGTLVLEPGLPLQSRKMTRALAPCTKARVFIATVGPRIERRIQKLTDDNRMSEASILDAIASVAVEDTVEKFQSKFDDELSDEGKRTTLRFSPGYCDWPIKEQRKVFKAVDGSEIDVSLTDTCLMRPRKSVSGVFGIGSEIELKERCTNPCMQCGMKHCTARRTKDN
jgi:hypothetical protein